MAVPLRNARHELFAQATVKGLTAEEAMKAAGYKQAGKSAQDNASHMKARPDVAARIAELLAGAAEKAEITKARVLAELGKIGFSDIRKLFDDDGRLKHITMLDDDAAASIQSIAGDAVKRRKAKDGDERDELEAEATLKIRLWDKRAALVDIGKHLGMFTEKVEHSGPDGGPIEIADADLARLIAFQLTKAARAAG